jgi:SAM-dependent methyltransferase
MSPVHEVAEAGFGTSADVYDRSRPSYPPDAVQFFVDVLAIAPGRRVCDLAAGTGIFTRLITGVGATLLACEPVAGMRAELRRHLPELDVVAGTAERLPFADATLDAVTIMQALHWFDGPAASAELHRVLKPGGRVGFAWNARDRSIDWVDRVWSIMDRVEKRAPWRDHDQSAGASTASGGAREQFGDPNGWTEGRAGTFTEGFSPIAYAHFSHEQPVTPEGVVERVAGVSHVQVLPELERNTVLDEVRSLVATHAQTAGRTDLAIPYRVDCYWTERLR